MKTNKMSPHAAAILDGINAAIAHAKGEAAQGTIEHHIPDVKDIRTKLGMSQNEFAFAFSLSPGTVRGWEQKRRKIDATAIALLRAIEQYPEQVRKAQHSQA